MDENTWYCLREKADAADILWHYHEFHMVTQLRVFAWKVYRKTPVGRIAGVAFSHLMLEHGHYGDQHTHAQRLLFQWTFEDAVRSRSRDRVVFDLRKVLTYGPNGKTFLRGLLANQVRLTKAPKGNLSLVVKANTISIMDGETALICEELREIPFS